MVNARHTQCESVSCLAKKRKRRPLWLIDNVPHCNPCFESWLETHYLDEHRVRRLSDRDEDFSEWSGHRVHAKNHLIYCRTRRRFVCKRAICTDEADTSGIS